MERQPDTIAAIATAPGRGGVGIVRVSGASLSDFALQLTGATPKPRHAGFVRFCDGSGDTLDEGILLYFRSPASFTGEDVLELQGHGGPVVMQMLLSRCLELGARLAAPGEFSRRAFLNGRMDLAQAEAVADLIEASTTAAARSAVRSLSGAFSERINRLKDELIDLRMLVEATLDFPEEEIDFLKASRALERLQEVANHLDAVLQGAQQGRLLRDGMRVVLVGRPNVGKSSLLNALTGEDSAIVTDIAGTTRDAVRETIQIKGMPVHVVDTAGLREATSDMVEQIGIQRTWAEIDNADVIVRLVQSGHSVLPEEAEIDARIDARIPRVVVENKIDMVGREAFCERDASGVRIGLSAKKGLGIDLLSEELARIAGWRPGTEDVPMARERHVQALKKASAHVAEAFTLLQQLELFAEELRLAHESLGEITGEFTPDDLLGVIFSRFCIGK